MPCGNSPPPPTPWRSPPGFSSTPEASWPPSWFPTPDDSPDRFYRRPATFTFPPPSRPMAASCACFGRVLGGSVCGGALPYAAPPGSSLTPLTSYPPSVAVSEIPASPAPPPRGLGLLLRCRLLRLFSPPLGAFVCTLLRAATSPLLHCLSFALVGPLLFVSSLPPTSPSPLYPPSSLDPPPPYRASFPVCPCILPLTPHSHLCHFAGSCVLLRRPLRLLPRPGRQYNL